MFLSRSVSNPPQPYGNNVGKHPRRWLESLGPPSFHWPLSSVRVYSFTKALPCRIVYFCKGPLLTAALDRACTINSCSVMSLPCISIVPRWFSGRTSGLESAPLDRMSYGYLGHVFAYIHHLPQWKVRFPQIFDLREVKILFSMFAL